MDLFVVRGGRPLVGAVRVSGSKNATLPMMAAALLAEGTVRLDNVPQLVDVATLAAVLRSLGVDVAWTGPGQVSLTPQDPTRNVAAYDLVRKMRASVCVLGPLLARRGFACVSLPGGCAIGDRPIDLHLKGLRALGAELEVSRGYVLARARRLRGARVHLGGPQGSTVTGTCNVLAAATLAQGRTTIEAAACEPEVVDLGRLLQRMGARIQGLGTPLLEIEGVETLHGADAQVIPDRIEAGTWLLAAAITRGTVTVTNACPAHLEALLEQLQSAGVDLEIGSTEITARAAQPLRPFECVALPYPGFPTDLQAQCVALATTLPGVSVITDKVFPDRFLHVPELVRLGARIRREGASAVVTGVRQLTGACVMASDLRASAALVLAALAAEGESVIRRIYHLDRGYEALEHKLAGLGGAIRRVPDDPSQMPACLAGTTWGPLEEPATSGGELAAPKFLRGRSLQSAEKQGEGVPLPAPYAPPPGRLLSEGGIE